MEDLPKSEKQQAKRLRCAESEQFLVDTYGELIMNMKGQKLNLLKTPVLAVNQNNRFVFVCPNPVCNYQLSRRSLNVEEPENVAETCETPVFEIVCDACYGKVCNPIKLLESGVFGSYPDKFYKVLQKANDKCKRAMMTAMVDLMSGFLIKTSWTDIIDEHNYLVDHWDASADRPGIRVHSGWLKKSGGGEHEGWIQTYTHSFGEMVNNVNTTYANAAYEYPNIGWVRLDKTDDGKVKRRPMDNDEMKVNRMMFNRPTGESKISSTAMLEDRIKCEEKVLVMVKDFFEEGPLTELIKFKLESQLTVNRKALKVQQTLKREEEADAAATSSSNKKNKINVDAFHTGLTSDEEDGDAEAEKKKKQSYGKPRPIKSLNDIKAAPTTRAFAAPAAIVAKTATKAPTAAAAAAHKKPPLTKQHSVYEAVTESDAEEEEPIAGGNKKRGGPAKQAANKKRKD